MALLGRGPRQLPCRTPSANFPSHFWSLAIVPFDLSLETTPSPREFTPPWSPSLRPPTRVSSPRLPGISVLQVTPSAFSKSVQTRPLRTASGGCRLVEGLAASGAVAPPGFPPPGSRSPAPHTTLTPNGETGSPAAGAVILGVCCACLRGQHSSAVFKKEPLGIASSICRFKSQPRPFLVSDSGRFTRGDAGFFIWKTRTVRAAGEAGNCADQ